MGWVSVPALLEMVSKIHFSADVYGHTPMSPVRGQRASYILYDDSKHRNYSKCSPQAKGVGRRPPNCFLAGPSSGAIGIFDVCAPLGLMVVGILFTPVRLLVEDWRVVASAKLETIHVCNAHRPRYRRGPVGKRAISKGDSPFCGE